MNTSHALRPVLLDHQANSRSQITVEIIEYVPDREIVETVIRKTQGQVSAMLVDDGEVLTEKSYPFETFAQVIDGIAEIVICGEAFYLNTGQSIVIPPFAPNYIRPFGGFKMILTMIKDGEL